MLMITRSEEGERGYILKLEGKLLRPWIDELALACSDARIDAKRVNLDLDGLTFVGCDRASANVFGGNRTIFCLKGPSVPIATGPEA
jgi:hypothetical protein